MTRCSPLDLRSGAGRDYVRLEPSPSNAMLMRLYRVATARESDNRYSVKLGVNVIKLLASRPQCAETLERA
jgi:hypothetical protein